MRPSVHTREHDKQHSEQHITPALPEIRSPTTTPPRGKSSLHVLHALFHNSLTEKPNAPHIRIHLRRTQNAYVRGILPASQPTEPDLTSCRLLYYSPVLFPHAHLHAPREILPNGSRLCLQLARRRCRFCRLLETVSCAVRGERTTVCCNIKILHLEVFDSCRVLLSVELRGALCECDGLLCWSQGGGELGFFAAEVGARL